MQVLENEDERALLGEALEETAPGRERLVPAIAAELCFAGEPEEREEMRLDTRLVTRSRERVLDSLAHLRRRCPPACPARGHRPAP